MPPKPPKKPAAPKKPARRSVGPYKLAAIRGPGWGTVREAADEAGGAILEYRRVSEKDMIAVVEKVALGSNPRESNVMQFPS